MPRRNTIPAGYELNPDTGRLRKSCTRNQYRSPDTGRCRKIQPVARVRAIPAGYEINPATGRLRKSCRANQVRNPISGRCGRPPRQRSHSPRRQPVRGTRRRPARVSPRRNAVPFVPLQLPPIRRTQNRARNRSRSRSPQSSLASQECNVCYEKTRRGVARCGHKLCKKCYRGMRRVSARGVCCPYCRGQLSRTPSPRR